MLRNYGTNPDAAVDALEAAVASLTTAVASKAPQSALDTTNASVANNTVGLATLSSAVNHVTTGLATKAATADLTSGLAGKASTASLTITNANVTANLAAIAVLQRSVWKSGGARGRFWAAGEPFSAAPSSLVNGWGTFVSGAGSVTASGSNGAARWDGRGAPGTGTTLNGRSSVGRFNAFFARPVTQDDGCVFVDCRQIPLTAGTAAENYYLAFGYSDMFAAATAGQGVQGVFIYYESQTSANYRVVVRKASVTTLDFNTGIPVTFAAVAPLDYDGWSIEVDYLGARVYFTVSGTTVPVLIYTIAPEDLPTASDNRLGAGGWRAENLTTRAVSALSLIDQINTGRMPASVAGYLA